MLEKRKHKRLKMEHALELARLNADGTADDGVVNADILNISRGGIGFLSRKSLEVGSYYDTRISLFSREMIDAVLEIVHVEEQEKGYYYGGEFIGISDSNAVKIDIYQVFTTSDRENRQKDTDDCVHYIRNDNEMVRHY